MDIIFVDLISFTRQLSFFDSIVMSVSRKTQSPSDVAFPSTILLSTAVKITTNRHRLFFRLSSGTIPIPSPDLFPPAFPPPVLPAYPFDHAKYPTEYATLPPKTSSSSTTTPATNPNSPSRTPPKSPSESGSESAPEEIRSAFVPIRLNTLPPMSSAITASSSSPERILPKKAIESTRNELKAPTALISRPLTPKRTTPSPGTKISSTTKPVWRPY